MLTGWTVSTTGVQVSYPRCDSFEFCVVIIHGCNAPNAPKPLVPIVACLRYVPAVGVSWTSIESCALSSFQTLRHCLSSQGNCPGIKHNASQSAVPAAKRPCCTPLPNPESPYEAHHRHSAVAIISESSESSDSSLAVLVCLRVPRVSRPSLQPIRRNPKPICLLSNDGKIIRSLTSHKSTAASSLPPPSALAPPPAPLPPQEAAAAAPPPSTPPQPASPAFLPRAPCPDPLDPPRPDRRARTGRCARTGRRRPAARASRSSSSPPPLPRALPLLSAPSSASSARARAAPRRRCRSARWWARAGRGARGGALGGGRCLLGAGRCGRAGRGRGGGGVPLLLVAGWVV